MKTIGIAAHSAEGGALCFITACREGEAQLGLHMHPPIVVSAIPMGLSMPSWESDDHKGVAKFLAEGVAQLAKAGADFYICPDNTAHIVLEQVAEDLPLPGLHIAAVVCKEIVAKGWKRVGLLGTNWTMTGPVYAKMLQDAGLERLIPDEPTRDQLHNAIFDELCRGKFTAPTTELCLSAIRDLQQAGAECVILGCTEIPIIVNEDNSPLPILDSTRLQAKYAVREALSDRAITIKAGWLAV